MNKPSPANPPELRSTFVAASSMPWQRTEFDGIEMKILYKDDEGRHHPFIPPLLTHTRSTDLHLNP